jgi:hypothetical protein
VYGLKLREVKRNSIAVAIELKDAYEVARFLTVESDCIETAPASARLFCSILEEQHQGSTERRGARGCVMRIRGVSLPAASDDLGRLKVSALG